MSTTKTKQRPSQSATPARSGADGGPQITPEMFTGAAVSLDGRAPDGPALRPPGDGGLAAQAADPRITATSATVGGLWTNNAASNAWAFLNGVGWRRISPANATSHQAMIGLARLARDAGAQVQCDEDGSIIHAMYVW